jgi:hypothetical protein
VDRFFPFFDIGLEILAGIVIVFVVDKLNAAKIPAVGNKGYLVLLLLLIPFYGALYPDSVFSRWGYPSDIAMGDYLQNLPSGSLVVAPGGIQSYWFSAVSGVHVLGGDSAQMIGPKFLGDSDSDLIINSPDVNRKMELIRKYGVNYIVIPYHANAPAMWNPSLSVDGINAFNNSAYFSVEQFFPDTYGSTVLLKVKENLTPAYAGEKSNGIVTFAGYLISGVTLCVLGYFSVRKRSGNSS